MTADVQLISAADAANPRGYGGRAGVIYVLNEAPHTAFRWDGRSLVAFAQFDSREATSKVTVIIGNSIAAGGNQGPGRDGSLNVWAPGSDVHFASQLTGGNHLRWSRITASTRADTWGVYSYSGQTLDTINGDLAAQLYAPLATAGVIPDLIIGHSLLENDVAAGATLAQMVSRLQVWLINAQMRYPGAIIWLCTPRPSFSYNSAAKAQAYLDITNYILSLDDNRSIFVSRMNGYENPVSLGTPLLGYTDSTVHPNVAGGQTNGRTLAATLLRIAAAGRYPYLVTSNNLALEGSTAASGTGVTGTKPTSTTLGAPGSTTTVVSAANAPGWTLEYTQEAGTAADINTLNTGAITVTDGGSALFAPFMKVRIDSGASQIRNLSLQARCGDGSTSPFYTFQGQSTAYSDGAYLDGDVLTMRMPPFNHTEAGTANPLTSITPYLRLTRKTGGGGASTVLTAGVVRFTVLAVGVALIG